jgi:glycosyltransferase involved in cell wall biosynthesis
MAIDVAADFDAVHSHVGPGGFVLSKLPGMSERVLHTIHSPVYDDMVWFAGMHPNTPLVAVSEYQAARLRQVGSKRCWVVPNGIDTARFAFNDRPGDGLIFIGRIEAAKGPDLAVAVARELGRPLTLAGPIVDPALFESKIEPYLGGGICYVGVVDHATKSSLLGRSACALLPFRQAEPFGMISIEAMACGTPVVALPNGALPEVVEQGVTGFLAPDERSLGAFTERATLLDRSRVRARVEARFGIERVAERYVELYHRLTGSPATGDPGAC